MVLGLFAIWGVPCFVAGCAGYGYRRKVEVSNGIIAIEEKQEREKDTWPDPITQ